MYMYIHMYLNADPVYMQYSTLSFDLIKNRKSYYFTLSPPRVSIMKSSCIFVGSLEVAGQI